MGMRHRQRLACETVRGRGGFHTAQQVIAYGLVVMVFDKEFFHNLQLQFYHWFSFVALQWMIS